MRTPEQLRALKLAADGEILRGTNSRRRYAGEFHSSTLASLYRDGLLARRYNDWGYCYEYAGVQMRWSEAMLKWVQR